MQRLSHPRRARAPYLMCSAVHTGGGFHILQGLVVEVLQRISMMYVAKSFRRVGTQKQAAVHSAAALWGPSATFESRESAAT